MPKPQFAIIGGGIAGLTLAIGLNKRGVDVTIYEQAPAFGEIGAGVAFTANSVEAMKILDKGVYDAYEEVATMNEWEDKKKVWFDFMDGTAGAADGSTGSGHQDSVFTIYSKVGTNGVHRAKFLDGMIHLIPEGMAKFDKHLDTLEELDNGRIKMKFHDGSSAEADAVIGTDGIKSTVREWMDKDGPEPVYTHKYAYRGIVPIEEAIKAVGEERARNACLWMGQDRHMLTFQIDHGKTLNIVAFVTKQEDWPAPGKTTLPAKIEEALEDYKGFGPNVIALLKLCKTDLDAWAIYDLGDNPLKQYNKGKVCLVGDSASATTPHHGAGAGMCIESAAVLADILADAAMTGEPGTIEAAFEAYSEARILRTQWLTHHSRRTGDLYEWRTPDIGKDFTKIQQELIVTNYYIEEMDVKRLCEEGVAQFRRKLESRSKL